MINIVFVAATAWAMVWDMVDQAIVAGLEASYHGVLLVAGLALVRGIIGMIADIPLVRVALARAESDLFRKIREIREAQGYEAEDITAEWLGRSNTLTELLAEMREETYGPPAKKVGSSMETEGTGYSSRALRKARQRVAKGRQRPGAPVMEHLD